MKLPHKDPLVFAKKIISLSGKKAEVFCEFPQIPTFGMLIEASAQASAAFFQEGDFKMGYLVNTSDVELMKEISEQEYSVYLEAIFSFQNLTKYSFQVKEQKTKNSIMQGELTVSIE